MFPECFRSPSGDREEHFDCLTSVHGGVTVGDLIERKLKVEHGRRIDASRREVVEKLREVHARSCHRAGTGCRRAA